MADFNTHLMGAAAVSGLAATVLVMTGAVPHQAVIGYFVLGVIGGLLPDIDLPTSVPVRIAFATLAVVAGFLVVFTFGSRYSLVELVILWLGCFLLIRYGLFDLFDRLYRPSRVDSFRPDGHRFRAGDHRRRLSCLQRFRDPCLAVRNLSGDGFHRPSVARRVLQRRSVRQEIAEKLLRHRASVWAASASPSARRRSIWRLSACFSSAPRPGPSPNSCWIATPIAAFPSGWCPAIPGFRGSCAG